jgi:hypothetical protein
MKPFHKRALMSFVFAATAMGAVCSAHAEVVNIPWTAAMQTSASPSDCFPQFPTGYGSWANECYLAIPISVPVGHTIQQITVYHGTENTMPPGQPFFEAYLNVDTLTPSWNEVTKFQWNSSSAVPDGTIEKHSLMTQFGKVYVDQFPVAPSTTYNLSIALHNGAYISAVEITYN